MCICEEGTEFISYGLFLCVSSLLHAFHPMCVCCMRWSDVSLMCVCVYLTLWMCKDTVLKGFCFMFDFPLPISWSRKWGSFTKKGIVKSTSYFPSQTLEGANLPWKCRTSPGIPIDVHPTRNAELADICAFFNWMFCQVGGRTGARRLSRAIVPLKDTAHHLCATCCSAFYTVCLLPAFEPKQTQCSDSVFETARHKESRACG